MSRCVIIGNESLALACASVLQRTGHEIIAFVTDPGAAADRARLAGLPVIASLDSLLDASSVAPDYLFSITNLRVLSPAILALPRRAAINYHDGPLPRYGGLNAPVFALLNGERDYGISWHLMTAAVDEGGVLVQETFELAVDETAFTLNARCYEAALEGFEKLVPMLGRDLPPAPHAPLDSMSFSPRGRRPASGAVVDWTCPAEDVARMVRALDHGRYPNPVACASVLLADKVLLVGSAEPLPQRSQADAGTIITVDNDGITVATVSSDLRLSRMCDTEGHRISAADPAGDSGLRAGARFDVLTPARLKQLEDCYRVAGKHEAFWLRRIDQLEQADVPGTDRTQLPGAAVRHELAGLPAADTPRLAAAMLGLLGRIGGKDTIDVGLSHPALAGFRTGVEAWFAPAVPLRTSVDEHTTFTDLESAVGEELQRLGQRATWAVDAPARHRGMREGEPVRFEVGLRTDADAALPEAVLTCCLYAGRVTLWHDPARLPPVELRRVADGFRALLAAAVVNPSTAVIDLPIMAEAESRVVVGSWNATEAPWRDDICVPTLFEEQAERTPDAIAVVDANGSLTYRELEREANQLAHHLGAHGVGPDSIVGLHVQRTTGMVVAILGIHKAGGAYLPLDPSYPAERLAFMVEDAGARIILSDDPAGLPGAASATVVPLGPAGHATSGYPTTRPARTISPKNLAYVIYTSGSTGRPKGVMVEHRNVVNFCAAMDACLGTQPGTWLAVTSLSFDISVLELVWTLTRGYKVVIHGSDGGPELIPALIWQHGVTDLQCTPSLATMLLLTDASGPALAQLRHLLVGGEALSATLADALLGQVRGEVRNMYGPTETTIWSTSHHVADAASAPPLGRPIANTQLYLLDRRQRPVPIGVVGELYIGGAGVVRGYLHRAELTAERFVANPFGPGNGRLYRTGDLARYRADGVLDFLGRVDHQVKIRGHRIELGEIEHQLLSATGVRDAVAIARQDGRGDTTLVAYVVPKAGMTVDPALLRDDLRAVLPDYMVPSHVVALDSLPLTPNLKVDRKALPSPTEAPGSRPTVRPGDEPRGGTEEQVAEVWRAMLTQERVGRYANFFDLGGHSLLAIQVHHRLRQLFPEKTLSITDLFRHPTIAGLASLLNGGADPGAGPQADVPSPRPEPTYFGDPSSPLFGMLHRAVGGVAIGKVLLCYPLPPKYMLCYRAFQRLAVSLAESGFDVLRFDYFGTGDSAGDPADGSASRWTADCEAALQHLSAQSGASSTALVGMRLGAALAGLVAARRDDVDALVLWEPVVEGADYVAELERLAAALGRPGSGGAMDILGFPLSAELRTSLRSVSLLSNPPRARRTLLLQGGDRPQSDLLAARLPGLERERLGGLEDWARLIEADSILLPMPHLRRIVQFLTEGRSA